MNETADKLLTATRHCIAANGLAATTSREITATAGVNLAGITYHFGSKDELVAAALLDELREWLAPALEVLAGGGDASARTVVAIQTLTATFEEHRERSSVYLEALIQGHRMEPLRAGLAELCNEVRAVLAEHISELQGQGELGGWVRADTMAAVLLAVANGLVLQVVADPDGPSLPAMASQFGALLLAARTGP